MPRIRQNGVQSILSLMFTGIVEATATVHSISDHRMIVERPSTFTDIIHGSSIAVSGVCLSVADLDTGTVSFDIVDETRSKTTLGSLEAGSTVNLERSVALAGRLDGHIVQGHVEGVGRVLSRMPQEEGEMMTIALPDELNTFCVQKGSITIDGVSLTIVDTQEDQVSITLVPHTLKNTTLGMREEGEKVNIETDIIGRYLYAFIHEKGSTC